MKRGEIWYINRADVEEYGNEMRSGRPGIIVAVPNEKLVTVVYLTTRPLDFSPLHVPIHSSTRECVALCEQITTVDVGRVGTYVGECADEEMANVKCSVAKALDLIASGAVFNASRGACSSGDYEVLAAKLSVAEEDAKLYRRMYETLVETLARGAR